MESAETSRALAFLESQQLPSGQFRMDYHMMSELDDSGAPVARPERSPFCSMYIAHALAIASDPRARAMLQRTIDFLESQEQPGGLWRYWNTDAPLFSQIPADADDTSCISQLLREQGMPPRDNEEILLLNRTREGLFYTWIIPRASFLRSPRHFFTLVRDLTRGRAFEFWNAGAGRGDVDSVVNANVVSYLGKRAETEVVVDYLLDIAESGGEGQSDRWYRSACAFYYSLGRCYTRGIGKLAAIADLIESRLAPISRSDGQIGDDVLQTSLAASALMSFGIQGTLLDEAMSFVARAQQSDGGWESRPFYFDGRPRPQIWWGSRATTTGFCLEAMLRYSRRTAAVA